MTRSTSNRQSTGTTLFGEALEPRVMFADDHPNLSAFPAATEFSFSPFTANTIYGGAAGVLEESGDTDVFRFTVPVSAGAGVSP